MICVKLRFNCLCAAFDSHGVSIESFGQGLTDRSRKLRLQDVGTDGSASLSESLSIPVAVHRQFTLHRLQFTIVSMLQLCYVSISFGPWVIHMCVGDLARFAHHLLLQRLLQVVMA